GRSPARNAGEKRPSPGAPKAAGIAGRATEVEYSALTHVIPTHSLSRQAREGGLREGCGSLADRQLRQPVQIDVQAGARRLAGELELPAAAGIHRHVRDAVPVAAGV